jgi:hypothetical protein
VIPRRAEAIADSRINRVAAGTRVDEKRTTSDRQRNRERVGMRVAAVEKPVTAGVDGQVVAAG